MEPVDDYSLHRGLIRSSQLITILAVPKAFYRRRLPHLQRDNKAHFLTFCTYQRWILPEEARSIVLECCRHDDGSKIDLQASVVMPDHVHLIFTPLVDQAEMEVCSLGKIMHSIKGASAHKVNQALKRKGKVWQTESFDHVLRPLESLEQKIQYLLENPLRRGLVCRWQEYPWIFYRVPCSPYSRKPK